MVTSEVVVGLCSVSLWCCNETKTLVVDFHNCKKLPHRGGVIAFSHEDSGGSFWLTRFHGNSFCWLYKSPFSTRPRCW